MAGGLGPAQLRVGDRAGIRAALLQPRPVLIHLNADTTWLLSLPYPPSHEPPPGRSRFNVLLDPWLQGPQSDVASWFSIQRHVVEPSVRTIDAVNQLLVEVEQADTGADTTERPKTFIDVVAISHEFTDHCHEATLRELPRDVPVLAAEKAAALIKSWNHFDQVIVTPGFSATTSDWQKALSVDPLPSWIGIGRVVSAGNALYYHSAVMVVFKQAATADGQDVSDPAALIYSPHGIKASDLEIVRSAGITTLALLHGLHDVRIWMMKQLNLGALNGLEAVRVSGAKYWVATHDEIKKGGGLITPMLRRTPYALEDAVMKETKSRGKNAPDYKFVELGSGDGLVLS